MCGQNNLIEIVRFVMQSIHNPSEMVLIYRCKDIVQYHDSRIISISFGQREKHAYTKGIQM